MTIFTMHACACARFGSRLGNARRPAMKMRSISSCYRAKPVKKEENLHTDGEGHPEPPVLSETCDNTLNAASLITNRPCCTQPKS